jgi:2-polyprenyl-3-methyl-5-hydroxy-6-metoxy-1,4-benzoquinol methylase
MRARARSDPRPLRPSERRYHPPGVIRKLTGRSAGTAPATVRRPVIARVVEHESRPEDGGLETFETPQAAAINTARLDHLASLRLDLDGKRVLDVGCGPGHLAQFFVRRGCRVLSTDAREDNIARLKELYPAHEAAVVDVEQGSFEQFGRFDIVFCYGLLYHLESPVAALRNLVNVCDGVLLLETVICDSDRPVLLLEDEYLSLNQALRGIAHRPSPSWVATALNRIGISHVYAARTPPAHPDFQFDWRNNLDASRDGHLLRGVFVGAHERLDNEQLLPLVAHMS